MSGLAEIEQRRIELGISVCDLERAAGTAQRYYSKLRQETHVPSAGLVARFRLALIRLKTARESDVNLPMMVCYRMAVAMAANALGRDPLAVHAQAPGRRATQDPEWMEAAAVRRLAVYLMHTGAGFRQTETGAAAGMTKQAVSLACKDVEDLRDDPEFDRLVDALTAQIAGDW